VSTARRILGPAIALPAGALAGWAVTRYLPYAVSNAALNLALVVFLAAAGAAFLGGSRKWPVALLAAAALAGFWGAAALTNASIDRLAVTHARARTILDAIDAHSRDALTVAHRLEDLVPRYLPAVPPTGWGGDFHFERGNGWYRLSFLDAHGVRHGFHSTVRQWRAE
jgi:hypothetical protein